ncbi:MAG TPA: hypothetical protein VG321_05375 [Solirubrobacteraceae bacterium]|nr:hypothetical protein [Solirubrobacteraceae bacterium]
MDDLEDPVLPTQFRSDRENGMISLFRRERRYPELLDGMSVYGSPAAAGRLWLKCRETARERGEPMRIGAYVAEVELTPGQEFSIEDLHEDNEHLTIWGDPDRLAAATRRIYAPATEPE